MYTLMARHAAAQWLREKIKNFEKVAPQS